MMTIISDDERRRRDRARKNPEMDRSQYLTRATKRRAQARRMASKGLSLLAAGPPLLSVVFPSPLAVLSSLSTARILRSASRAGGKRSAAVEWGFGGKPERMRPDLVNRQGAVCAFRSPRTEQAKEIGASMLDGLCQLKIP